MKVFIVAALTADGFIARDGGHAANWTGRSDKKVFVRLTKDAGVMVMGSRTFATIGRALPERRNIVLTSKPQEINVEGVEATNESPAVLLERLKREGARAVAICGGASVYDSFMRAGLVDELYLTYVPIVFGQGVTLLNDTLDAELELEETEELTDGAILLHYKIKKS